MFDLLLLPLRLMISLYKGMFRLAGSLFVAFFSILTGLWPIFLIGGVLSLVFGLIRCLWPLICAGGIALLCYILYQAGLQHAKDHPNDRFAQFVNRVRS